MTDGFRIANCSGFYGDRFSAAREMVEGGPIDVLTGDYLAERTLQIMLKDKLRDPKLGFARNFLPQLREVAGFCAERGIPIVVDAGGVNPASLARAAEDLYRELGVRATVAYLEGDDLLPQLEELTSNRETLAHLDTGSPLETMGKPILSANAYLGAFGIVEALERGADLVICPRITDASLTLGPAAWKFGWKRDNWDVLAAGVVAGHIIECGPQCSGGNYSFFTDAPNMTRPGFPIAEMYEDGSFVITKHEGTDGIVDVGTVTAQLLYEISGPRYANPDVVARLDTVNLVQEGPDRVRVSGVRGEPAPPTSKVCVNYAGGYRNSVTFMVPGLDIEKKAQVAQDGFWSLVGGQAQFAEVRTTLQRGGSGDSERFALLTIAARDEDESKTGEKFYAAVEEMGLSTYPGYEIVKASPSATAVFEYWPGTVAKKWIDQRVVIGNQIISITPAPDCDEFEAPAAPAPIEQTVPDGDTRDIPLGRVFGARSGDKGGIANLGLWAGNEEAYVWLVEFLTVDRLKEVFPEAAPHVVDRYELPNLLSINFVIHGLLDQGCATTLRIWDPQAKYVCEEVRAAIVPIPFSLLEAQTN